ncbi:hypothetical protein BYT27DRAFT_7195730, partial [Phlegmacium glaucopus]
MILWTSVEWLTISMFRIGRQVTERGATQLRAAPKLSNGQVMRLLSGCWSLSLWECSCFKLSELVDVQAPSCTNEAHQRYSATWEPSWVSTAGWKRILGLNSADVCWLVRETNFKFLGMM